MKADLYAPSFRLPKLLIRYQDSGERLWVNGLCHSEHIGQFRKIFTSFASAQQTIANFAKSSADFRQRPQSLPKSTTYVGQNTMNHRTYYAKGQQKSLQNFRQLYAGFVNKPPLISRHLQQVIISASPTLPQPFCKPSPNLN